MNWWIDLPNLTLFTSRGSSFNQPHLVTLSSLIWTIEYWIDIPNVETVNLPDSFQYVQSKSISSILINESEWLDVSTILASLVKIKSGKYRWLTL